MNSKKRSCIIMCTMLLAFLIIFPGAGQAKDKIVIGQAVSLSGPNAIIHAAGGLPVS